MGIQLNGSSGADIISSSDGTITIDGTSTVSTPIVTNTITISDKISHTGDSNTHIRFAGDDTVTVETAGGERLRIDSSGRIGLGIANPGDYFSSYNRVVMGRTNDTGGMTIVSANDSAGYIAFADGTSGNEAYRGRIIYSHGGSPGDFMSFHTDATEKFRIASTGRVAIGNATNNASPTALFGVKADDGEAADLYVGQFDNLEATAGQSYGVAIRAGSNSTDHGFRVKNRANDTTQFLVRGDGNIGINESSPTGKLTITNSHQGFVDDSAQPQATFLIKHGTSGTDRRWIGIGASTTGAWLQSSSPGGSGLAAPFWINKGGGDVTLGSDKLTVASGGAVSIAVGDLTLSDGNLVVASGHGINFAAQATGAQQNSPTVDDELLQYYEKGKWDPVLKKNNVANATPDIVHGRYVRVGQKVWLSCYMRWNSGSNAQGTSGGWTLHGLPFSLQDDNPGTCRIYQFAPIGYFTIDGVGYSYGHDSRWQCNNNTYFDLYTDISSADLAWTTGMMNMSMTGTFMIHE